VEVAVASGGEGERPDMRRSVARDVQRHARREPSAATFWRSLSVLGTVGWSIALPAAGGALLGHHLDAWLGTGVRFTLMLLAAGVLLGAVLAWHVVGSSRR
jgi:ATP synthase protein I